MNLFDWQSAGSAFFSLALGTVLRSLVLAALCAVAAWLLRSRPAALRFNLWHWTLLALFALPVLISLTPPVPKAAHALTHLQLTPLVTPVSATASHAVSATPVNNPKLPSLLILMLWLLVALLLLAHLAYNLQQLQRIASRSHAIPDPSFRELANYLWLASGAPSKPSFAVSHEVSVPVTFNTLADSWILLPATWTAWEEPKLRAVLTHELAHVQRADSTHLLLAAFATCVFWFHPLSWFLQSRLSRLAEEACDEIVLATTSTPEQYAQFLITFAQDVQRKQHRLATTVVRKSHLQKRLERLFTHTRPVHNWLAAVVLAGFVSTLYLTAAARVSEPQTSPQAAPSWPDWHRFAGLSPADVADIQSAIDANPNDIALRMQLIVFFGANGMDKPFTDQVLWLIQHDPSIPSLGEVRYLFPPIKPFSDTYREQIQAAWEDAVATNPDSVQVLLNAASFLEKTDQIRGLELLRKAQAIDPKQKQFDYDIAAIYAAAEMQGLSPATLNNIQIAPETGSRLRADVANSQDPALLTEVGRTLAELAHPIGGKVQEQRGLELIHRAVLLDPTNPEWKRALKLADLSQAMASPPLSVERTATVELKQSSGVMLSPSAAEAGLITKVDPIYPPEALAAHVQGIVQFTATVGADGTITQLQLVHGPPELVQAAKDGVLKWLYHPAMQNGQPIPFVTEVMVSFKLPH